MRNLYFTLLFLFTGLFAGGQEYNTLVQEIIDNVSQDSLIQQLRNISGEDPVMVGGELTTIEHRVSSWGNDLAAQYIFETLEGYGLEPFYQDYSSGGRNVLAVQVGTQHPEEYYMICGHYDAVDFYCADDNGSGTVGVLEAARLFTQRQFEYSIIYALWDEEEIGLIGSNYYATQAATNNQVIHAVINMDMIAWDGDGDMAVEIHSSLQASSDVLSDYIVEIDGLYELATVPDIKIPGTTASDHSRFWNNGYAAVLLIEEYYGGDFNPYYHSEDDRIAILNMPYFHEMARLAIGSLASMAAPVMETGTTPALSSASMTLGNHPNPFSTTTSVNFFLETDRYVRLTLFNSQGQKLEVLEEGDIRAGSHVVQLNGNDLPDGLYFLRLESADRMLTHKILVQ